MLLRIILSDFVSNCNYKTHIFIIKLNKTIIERAITQKYELAYSEGMPKDIWQEYSCFCGMLQTENNQFTVPVCIL